MDMEFPELNRTPPDEELCAVRNDTVPLVEAVPIPLCALRRPPVSVLEAPPERPSEDPTPALLEPIRVTILPDLTLASPVCSITPPAAIDVPVEIPDRA